MMPPLLPTVRQALRQVSLKTKLLIVIMVTSTVSLTLGCTALVVTEIFQLRDSMVQELVTQAALVGQNSTAALAFQDQNVAKEILEAFRHQPNITQAILFTNDRKILASYGDPHPPALFQSSSQELFHSRISWDSVEVSHEIVLDGEPVGILYISSSMEPLYSRLQDMFQESLFVIFLALALAGVISSRLQRLISSPLIHLATIAKQVSDKKDYSLRAQAESPDEIGVLISNFNEMLRQIEERDIELARHRNHLTDLVAAQTIQLRETNQSLEKEIQERTVIAKQLLDSANDLEIKNRELAHSRDEALQAARAKAEFLATMSHEIRTPMNGILGMTGLLLESPLTKDQTYLANTVKQSAEALLAILNDILDFSKMEAGKLELESINFNLTTTLEDTLDIMAERASKKNLELTGLVFPDVPTMLNGDPGRLRQILLNLIGNAIKFTEQGSVSVQVLLANETPSHVEIRFHIWDTGVGIPFDVQEKLFTSFTQADSSTTRKYGGTGLGLAICKQLVNMMNGEIGVESQPGAWSLFWFSIQLSKPNSASQVEWIPRSDLQGIRVLCVDDNPVNLFLLQSHVSSWGMRDVGISNPQEAIQILQDAARKDQPFDVAILDRDMPGLDGLTMATLIKQDPTLSKIKLILLTSVAHRGEAGAAQKSGFAAYLVKPLRKVQLHDCLLTILGYCALEETNQSLPLVTRHTLRENQRQTRKKILVVDDHATNRELAVLLLDRLGLSCDVVTNGREAVDAIASKSYAAVLMDCQMPIMDGFEASREIRKRENLSEHATPLPHDDPAYGPEEGRHFKNNRIPIIALTASAMPGDREKCLKAGMDDYLTKPIQMEHLKNVLGKWLSLTNQDEPVKFSYLPSAHQLKEPSPVISTTVATVPEAATASDISQTSCSLQPEKLEEWRQMGGEALLSRVVAQFVQDATTCVEKLTRACSENNFASFSDAGHGLKGISANIGAMRLQELGYAAEQVIHQDSAPDLNILLEQINKELATVQTLFKPIEGKK